MTDSPVSSLRISMARTCGSRPGQGEVQHSQVELVNVQRIDGVGAAAGHLDVKALIRETKPYEFHDGLFVLDEKQPQAHRA